MGKPPTTRKGSKLLARRAGVKHSTQICVQRCGVQPSPPRVGCPIGLITSSVMPSRCKVLTMKLLAASSCLRQGGSLITPPLGDDALARGLDHGLLRNFFHIFGLRMNTH